MANTISFKSERCGCSNGCTSVLLTVMGLSGSRLAQTDHEKNMIVWLMEKDQSAVGIGTVGFDITRMPWKKKYFEEQKQFMLQVLNSVRQKNGWETLAYEPNEEMIFKRIDELEHMFCSIQADDINDEQTDRWLLDEELNKPIRNGYPKCKKHDIYMSFFGCMACNDN